MGATGRGASLGAAIFARWPLPAIDG